MGSTIRLIYINFNTYGGGVNIMYENLFCILPKKIIDLVHDLVYN
jgi:hypothetical protein